MKILFLSSFQRISDNRINSNIGCSIVLSKWIGPATERKLFLRSAGSNWIGHYFDNNTNGLTFSQRQAYSFQLEAHKLDCELQMERT